MAAATVHPFWGEVTPDWAGFSAGIQFHHSFFREAVTVFLGEECDEEGEEIEIPPATAQLDHFATTYRNFLDHIDTRLTDLQEAAFRHYRKHYAAYYEDEDRSGAPPLGIRSTSLHNAYIKDLAYLRLTEGGTIRLSIHYELDTEHGLELRFDRGQLAAIGGIAET